MSDILDRDGNRIASLGASTLCEAFQSTAAGRPGQVAHRTLDGTLEITYREFAERVEAIATGLHSIGVRAGDTVALMLRNRPEFSIADAAAMHLGATAFSVYNTLSEEQVAYVFLNAATKGYYVAALRVAAVVGFGAVAFMLLFVA